MLAKGRYSPSEGVSGYEDLVNLNYEGLIHTGLNTAFLIAVLYRKANTLPDELTHSIDPEVHKKAILASGWDVPGGTHFKPPYQSWVNRICLSKRWMFFAHAGVYLTHGLEDTGITNDRCVTKYDTQRISNTHAHAKHILDEDTLSMKQAFSQTSTLDEARSANVRVDLLDNLSALQTAQSRIISQYIGESEGYVQAATLSDAVNLGLKFRNDLLHMDVKDWLPYAILRVMDLYAEQQNGQVSRNDFYFDY